ncbi:uncharacterized protein LOC133289658 isoform X1 [Gastrolobium bilobum]|uniref:uncharacterized protein LOC133289658 isoform X1 n=2 Tax=Gastrolobium bilobum TaxID=150636 RepID=UPI002AB24A6A|nr:uncharacterized protein LOC133289658 isoform X1 [Gastrolobium bilobum]
MAPRADEYEQESLSATDEEEEDDDEGFKEDMAALARACTIAGTRCDNDFTACRDLTIHSDQIQAEDPLLAAGDAIVPVTDDFGFDSDSDADDIKCLERVQSLYQPLCSLPPKTTAYIDYDDDDDGEDDFATVRAIFNRFSNYNEGPNEGGMGTPAEGDRALSLGYKGDIVNSSISDRSDDGELCPVSQYPNMTTNLLTANNEMKHCGFVESFISDPCKLTELPPKRSSFPPSAQAFIDAIKKNRSLQRSLRRKLTETEAKIEKNKELRDKVKILKDFQLSCIRRTGSALSLKKDFRIQLISAKKSYAPNEKNHKKISAMCYGPDENPLVPSYKMVLERFALSLDRKKWSSVERENLRKGIKEQFQKMVYQISVDRLSSECSFGGANDLDSITESVKALEISSEWVREFLPKVDWDQLASTHLSGRTGAECESRWLNCEDPLIKQDPWTREEDMSLLRIVQDKGIGNWIDIAESLAATNRTPDNNTNRTPFQCLARYQRSLNSSMLNSEWTEEEDAQLCSAVAYFGEQDWQSVASVLERRTGTQCSNRWKKSLYPKRKGSFTPEEDERLIVAVMLFGRKWIQVAKFVPGRTQSQCRDRYLNSLDPSLKWGGWTKEEDLRLEAAIVKHRFCWSKVAEDVPPRTDSQCRKRWRVLFPDQVPLLQEARKTLKSYLASNFVDRESERPPLTLNDFLPLRMLVSPSDDGAVNLPSKRKRESSRIRSKKHVNEARPCPKEVQDVVCSDQVNTCGVDVSFITSSNVPKKMRSKRHAKKARNCLKEVEDTVNGYEVETCIESSEIQDWDNKTLACFLRNKSKKRRFKCTKNVSPAFSPSGTTIVSKQIENQIPSGEEDGLSQSCGTDGTKDLSMRQIVVYHRQVTKPEDANRSTGDDDDDMTLACLMGNKSKKLKKGSLLLREVHCGNNPTIIVDGDRPSMSKLVEEETVLHGVAEPTNVNVEEKDYDLLASFLQNKTKRQRRRANVHKSKC